MIVKVKVNLPHHKLNNGAYGVLHNVSHSKSCLLGHSKSNLPEAVHK